MGQAGVEPGVLKRQYQAPEPMTATQTAERMERMKLRFWSRSELNAALLAFDSNPVLFRNQIGEIREELRVR